MNQSNIKEIKVGLSCHQKWSNMSGTHQKRLCDSCDKFVFNFLDSSTEEILNFIEERNGQKTCGMFGISQLKTIKKSLNNKPNQSIVKQIIIGAVMSTIVSCSASKKISNSNHEHNMSNVEVVRDIKNPDSTNTVLVEGTIYDETNEPLIGANFIINDSDIGCLTDLEGKFKIEISKEKLKSNSASIQYVGYTTLQIPLVNILNKEVKISMIDTGVLIGEVVIIKQPFHIRLWNGMKNIFR